MKLLSLEIWVILKTMINNFKKLLSILFIISIPIFADSIYLKDGKRISGKVISQNEIIITIKTDSGKIETLKLSDVTSVIYIKEQQPQPKKQGSNITVNDKKQIVCNQEIPIRPCDEDEPDENEKLKDLMNDDKISKKIKFFANLKFYFGGGLNISKYVRTYSDSSHNLMDGTYGGFYASHRTVDNSFKNYHFIPFFYTLNIYKWFITAEYQKIKIDGKGGYLDALVESKPIGYNITQSVHESIFSPPMLSGECCSNIQTLMFELDYVRKLKMDSNTYKFGRIIKASKQFELRPYLGYKDITAAYSPFYFRYNNIISPEVSLAGKNILKTSGVIFGQEIRFKTKDKKEFRVEIARYLMTGRQEMNVFGMGDYLPSGAKGFYPFYTMQNSAVHISGNIFSFSYYFPLLDSLKMFFKFTNESRHMEYKNNVSNKFGLPNYPQSLYDYFSGYALTLSSSYKEQFYTFVFGVEVAIE